MLPPEAKKPVSRSDAISARKALRLLLSVVSGVSWSSFERKGAYGTLGRAGDAPRNVASSWN